MRELFHLLTAGRLSPTRSPSPGRSPTSREKLSVRFVDSAPYGGRRALQSSRISGRDALSARTPIEESDVQPIDSDNEQLIGLNAELQRYLTVLIESSIYCVNILGVNTSI